MKTARAEGDARGHHQRHRQALHHHSGHAAGEHFLARAQPDNAGDHADEPE
jgi:hypothetical protein